MLFIESRLLYGYRVRISIKVGITIRVLFLYSISVIVRTFTLFAQAPNHSFNLVICITNTIPCVF